MAKTENAVWALTNTVRRILCAKEGATKKNQLNEYVLLALAAALKLNELMPQTRGEWVKGG